MDNFRNFLNLDPEIISTIIRTALTIISVFLVVAVGYYAYHFLIEKRNKR